MKNTILALLFLLIFSACNPKRDKLNNYTGKYDTTKYSPYSIIDTANASQAVSKCIANYMKDTSLVKHLSKIKLICVSFYSDEKDTLMAIEGFSAKPVISPQSKDEKYGFRGWLFFHDMPILFYDNAIAFGSKLYNVNKLLPDTIRIRYLKNQIAIPSWIYKISAKTQLELIHKTPAYRAI
jgi:hypothetical protein